MDLKFIFVCEEIKSGSCHLESSSSFGKAFPHAVPRENVSRFVKKKHPAVEFGGGVGSANEVSDKLKYK